MKKIAIVSFSVFFIACSAPRYSYYFDHYTPKKATSLKSMENETQKDVMTKAESSAKLNNSLPISLPELTASVSNETFIPATRHVTITDVHDMAPKKNDIRKKAIVKTLKNLIKSPDSIQESGNKNGFAIAGFVCSLVGLFVLWPLCILGLILSAIGLKSEKRGLAIAGLVIGIVGVALVLAGAAFVSL